MAPKKLILLNEKEPEAQRTNMQSHGQGDPTCFGNEPVRDTPSVCDRPSGHQHQTADNRIGTTEWCRCGNCVPMKTVEESSCCMEVSSVEKKYLQHGCICHSRKFYLRCLRKSHLEYLQIFWNMQRPTGGISSHNRKVHLTFTYRLRIMGIIPVCFPYVKQKESQGTQDKCKKLRQTSYRSFITWIYGFLGPKKRVPIPACVVQKVRSTYPDPKGRYRGFLQAFDYNAFDMAQD